MNRVIGHEELEADDVLGMLDVVMVSTSKSSSSAQ